MFCLENPQKIHEMLELEDGPSRLDLVTLYLWKAAQVQSLGWEDPLEKGMATHSSVLAWRIPWTVGLQRVRHY